MSNFLQKITSSLKKPVLTLFVLLLSSTTVQAQQFLQATCSYGPYVSQGAWEIPLNVVYEKGAVLARKKITQEITVNNYRPGGTASGGTITLGLADSIEIIDVTRPMLNDWDNGSESRPLAVGPGIMAKPWLGIRYVMQDYSGTEPGGFGVGYGEKNFNTALSPNNVAGWSLARLQLLRSNNNNRIQLRFGMAFDVELVVIDPVELVQHAGSFSKIDVSTQIGPQIQVWMDARRRENGVETNTPARVLCRGTDEYNYGDSGNDLRLIGGYIPQLPVPKQTCNFTYDTLNQQITLGDTDSASVAGVGATRGAGLVGEKTFYLNGDHCGLEASTLHLFFSDANKLTSTDSYLTNRSDAAGVGVRLYSGAQETPIPMGPAPGWGEYPNTPHIEISKPNGDTEISIPITAQYVSLPNGERKNGRVESQAIVTIVFP